MLGVIRNQHILDMPQDGLSALLTWTERYFWAYSPTFFSFSLEVSFERLSGCGVKLMSATIAKLSFPGPIEYRLTSGCMFFWRTSSTGWLSAEHLFLCGFFWSFLCWMLSLLLLLLVYSLGWEQIHNQSSTAWSTLTLKVLVTYTVLWAKCHTK